MKGRIAAAAVILAILIFPAATFAEGLDLWVGAGRLGGDSTYTIGGSVTDNFGGTGEIHSPLSELKWPLDVWMATVGVGADLGNFSLSGEVSHSLTSDAGDMEDSDWGIFFLDSGGNPFFRTDSKDIFSTSETDLTALTFDLRARYWALRKEGWSLGVGAGFLYENFDFEASNVNQYSPTAVPVYGLPFDPYEATVSGLGITYEVTHTIPFIEVAAAGRLGERVSVEASLGYSPIAMAEDTDDHVLRSKLSKGDCDGTAFMAGIDARFDITERWFAGAGFDYISISTDGTQTQNFYAGENVGLVLTIDQEITSSQTYFFLEAGYSFSTSGGSRY